MPNTGLVLVREQDHLAPREARESLTAWRTAGASSTTDGATDTSSPSSLGALFTFDDQDGHVWM